MEKGVCMEKGACMAGGECIAEETATAADSTHATGMHSCHHIFGRYEKIVCHAISLIDSPFGTGGHPDGPLHILGA